MTVKKQNPAIKVPEKSKQTSAQQKQKIQKAADSWDDDSEMSPVPQKQKLAVPKKATKQISDDEESDSWDDSPLPSGRKEGNLASLKMPQSKVPSGDRFNDSDLPLASSTTKSDKGSKLNKDKQKAVLAELGLSDLSDDSDESPSPGRKGRSDSDWSEPSTPHNKYTASFTNKNTSGAAAAGKRQPAVQEESEFDSGGEQATMEQPSH
ncbi:unnamed protein product, partial [Owenia fusiformis]